MLGWMVITRLPAIAAAKLGPDAGQRTGELGDQLPREVQWKADNYNHLMEQPTIFYAAALAVALAGLGTGLNLYMAWVYTASRIIHSLVHATMNKVLLRFMIFLVGTIALIVMVVNSIVQISS
jgi:hypothetical protein